MLGLAVTIASRRLNTDAIIAATRPGSTPAKDKPSKPVIAATSDPATARQLQLVWGVIPILIDIATSTDGVILGSIKKSVEQGLVQSDHSVLVVAGSLLGVPAKTNLMQIVKVDDVLTLEPLLNQQAAFSMNNPT
ncbi:MAG: pyruvate kinase alpha/beta domain-containing protein [Candidatus Hodarchaeales archaeon]